MKFTYESERLILKIINDDYAQNVLDFLYFNRQYFEPYEAPKVPAYYTLSYQKANLKLEYKSFLKRTYIRFYVFLKDNPDKIIGTVSFSNILPFPYQQATAGYKISHEFWGRGYAVEALTTAVNSLFKDGGFHRVDAFVLPSNSPSICVLNNAGFIKEGLCHRIICINGIYTDHLHYAVTAD